MSKNRYIPWYRFLCIYHRSINYDPPVILIIERQNLRGDKTTPHQRYYMVKQGRHCDAIRLHTGYGYDRHHIHVL